jgi:tRNA(fMet)-specific endonuclease VapC
MFLLDTDTLSWVLSPAPPANLLVHLAQVPPEQQFTTAITVGEMVYGAYRSQRPEHFLRQLEYQVWPNVRILPFDRAAGQSYGKIRAELERAGTPIGEPDTRIAAIALTHGLTLVTGNGRHFSRVPGLKIENWL